MTINFKDSTIKATAGTGINDVYSSNNGRNNLTVSGGSVEGTSYGIYLYYTHLTTNHTTIKTPHRVSLGYALCSHLVHECLKARFHTHP